MKILLNNIDLNEALLDVSNLGFVPTMGSLHDGHVSLIKESLKKCKKTIVSIFINPTQFNNKNDYKKYPKNIKKDLLILKKLKVNYVYIPKINHIYNSINKTSVKLKKEDKILCAKHRKGHFEGVINVMERLTNLIKPKKIFMGEKDYQQVYLVKKYIEKKYKTKIISCKTKRNRNKMALSSRNLLLNKNEISRAEKLTQNLFLFKRNLSKKKNISFFLSKQKRKYDKLYDIKIEYLELRNKFNLKRSNNWRNSKLFIAYYLNKIRLIDNI